MTIYVDNAFISAKVKQHNSKWCHLFSDNLDPEELHLFAESIGLRRSYFQHKDLIPQHDHYDVTENKRKEAIRKGATEVDIETMLEIIHNKKDNRETS